MAKLNQIKAYLDKELKVKKIKDASRNGLQYKFGNKVEKIGFAVDACLSTFERAAKENCNLLIVHHGCKWKPQKYLEALTKREQFLKKHKISLYGVHLPLDLHAKYGNNIGLARVLGLKKIKIFGKYHGFSLGYSGNLAKIMDIKQVAAVLNKELKTKCNVLAFGKKKIKTVGILSGGGESALEEAAKKKLDCFLVGEIAWGAYRRAEDYKQTVILAGHYQTETFGVKSLQKVLEEKFKVKTVFIYNPGRN